MLIMGPVSRAAFVYDEGFQKHSHGVLFCLVFLKTSAFNAVRKILMNTYIVLFLYLDIYFAMFLTFFQPK